MEELVVIVVDLGGGVAERQGLKRLCLKQKPRPERKMIDPNTANMIKY